MQSLLRSLAEYNDLILSEAFINVEKLQLVTWGYIEVIFAFKITNMATDAANY